MGSSRQQVWRYNSVQVHRHLPAAAAVLLGSVGAHAPMRRSHAEIHALGFIHRFFSFKLSHVSLMEKDQNNHGHQYGDAGQH
jgi:hypothetical protein